MSKQFEPGSMVGSYRVLSLLGKGGMGEVLLAEDVRLDRKVALKILPAHLVHDPERLRRFTQEARAASALNHPNILTIYEVGEAEGAPYIATEFIQGETLRSRLNSSRLSVRETLDIAIQAAGALAAAHEAGIVHRDIKPENIMIRDDGYIKILDFGLAKLTERAGSSSLETQAVTMTSPGMVMGTAQYMSPEQARGLPLDARSDIFSLGIVLYEMLAHKPPFEGETPSHLIVAIIEKSVPSIAMTAPEAPPQLEGIIQKALEKDREDRYQTAKDLAVDLRSVRRRLEVETELRRTTPSAGYPTAITPPTGYPVTGAVPQPPSGAQPAAASGHYAATALSSAPHPVQQPAPVATPPVEPPAPARERKRGRRSIIGTVVTILVAISIAKSIFLNNGSKRKKPDHHEFENLQLSRLTTSGKAFTAAISPDGKYVVYAESDKGLTSLWMRQTANASAIQIVPPAAVGYGGLSFSPDGNDLFFLRRSKDQPPAVYRMPVLGGTPSLVISNIHSAPSLSPDGKRFAFIRYISIDRPFKMEIDTAKVDGSDVQTVVPNITGQLVRSVAWSPDADFLAATFLRIEGGYRTELRRIKVKDGSMKPLTKKTWTVADQIAWTSDDDDLVLLATDQVDSSGFQIWHVDGATGDARRISNDINGYSSLSAAMNANQIVAVQPTQMAGIYVGTQVQDPMVTAGGTRSDGTGGITWTPDGHLVYSSRASGSTEIWIADGNGSNARQLTNGAIAQMPAVSPDGKYIFFTGMKSGSPNIWRINIDGSNLTQITKTYVATGPVISPDGKWVMFHVVDQQNVGISRTPIDGGPSEKLSNVNCNQWDYSADGKWILCGVQDIKTSTLQYIGLIPPAGGDVVQKISVPPAYASLFRFAPDSRSITYLYRDFSDKGAYNVMAQPLAGGPPKRLTNINSQIFYYAFSTDGKKLATSRGEAMNDVVLLKATE